MSNQKKGFTDEELKMMEEMESLIAEMKKRPEIANAKVPENLHKELFRDIREYEAEQAKAACKEPEPEVSRLTDEEKEWIRLGKKYKKDKKKKKIYVLIAAAVLAMGLGITSMGGPERVMERFERFVEGRDQTRVNSSGEDIKLVENVDEEEIYQQIEDVYGFWPVRLDYLPNGIEFMQGDLHNEMQFIQILYGNDSKVNITYTIRPNYRGSSLGIDVEDEVLEEYVEEVAGISIQIKKYEVSDKEDERWTAEFNYNDTQYYVMTSDISESELKNILNNLYFF